MHVWREGKEIELGLMFLQLCIDWFEYFDGISHRLLYS